VEKLRKELEFGLLGRPAAGALAVQSLEGDIDILGFFSPRLG
jgi:hypothetical protein